MLQSTRTCMYFKALVLQSTGILHSTALLPGYMKSMGLTLNLELQSTIFYCERSYVHDENFSKLGAGGYFEVHVHVHVIQSIPSGTSTIIQAKFKIRT